MDVSKRQPQHKKSSGRPAQNAATPPQKMVRREPNPDHLDSTRNQQKNQGEISMNIIYRTNGVPTTASMTEWYFGKKFVSHTKI